MHSKRTNLITDGAKTFHGVLNTHVVIAQRSGIARSYIYIKKKVNSSERFVRSIAHILLIVSVSYGLSVCAYFIT